MIVRVLLAALAAGLVAAIATVPLQYTKVVPIILHAEQFEDQHTHDHGANAVMVDHVHEDGTAHSVDHQPVLATEVEKPEAQLQTDAAESQDESFLLGRFWNTVMTGLINGAGFALLMAGISMACGVNVTFASGLVWGSLGWLCVQLLPSLGLPPALPGFPESDLAARQVWWVGTIGLSIVGFWLLLLTSAPASRVLGIAAIVAPHLYGAPQPTDIASAVPAYLAAQYAVVSLATTLFFWIVLGLALGWFMDRAKLDAA